MINLFIKTGQKPKIQKVANPEDIQFVYVDLFCGAGGTSTGLRKAKINGKRIALIAACVNHDKNALKSHWENYPEVVHFEEDIRTLNLTGLIDLIAEYRAYYPNAKIVLWASLECTNFSKAKGGQPRDADSRTLAEHLFRYIHALNPDYIQIENVVEFMSWGPLDSNGKPVSRKNGSEWLKWRKNINALGYRDEWKELNSADFGAYTSRNRLFGCFAKAGLPIVWPQPTHAKAPGKDGLFGSSLKKWMAVREVLDFDDEGISIFRRKKPLSDKTLERIYAGLIKYVAGGRKEFMVKWNSMSAAGKYNAPNIDEPCPVVSTQNRLGIANCSFLAKYFSGNPESMVISTDRPTGALKCKDSHSLITPSFMMKYYGNGENVQSVDEPAGTLTTKDRYCKVWLDKTYSGKDNHQSVDSPAGVIMVNDHHQFVKAIAWIDRNFSGGGQHNSVDGPAGSILNVPKMNLVQPFIMPTSFGNVGKSVDEPAPTLVASRRHHYIVNPSHAGHSTSVDKPCPVIIARQDKSPLYVVQTDEGDIPCFDGGNFLTDADMIYLTSGIGEPSIRVKIIEFMIMYGLCDIKMRMLKVSELKLIQGFEAEYVLHGNQTEKKKFIGNSVVPHVVECWTVEMGVKLIEMGRAA